MNPSFRETPKRACPVCGHTLYGSMASRCAKCGWQEGLPKETPAAEGSASKYIVWLVLAFTVLGGLACIAAAHPIAGVVLGLLLGGAVLAVFLAKRGITTDPMNRESATADMGPVRTSSTQRTETRKKYYCCSNCSTTFDPGELTDGAWWRVCPVCKGEIVINRETADTSSDEATQQFVCDFCGRTFTASVLDAHCAKITKEAAEVVARETMMSGVAHVSTARTFDEHGKAWCPHCFKDAESLRTGGRTVHAGKRSAFLPPPSIGVAYTCECGSQRTFNCKSVNVLTGLEVMCAKCKAVLFVPPTIFDHSTYWAAGHGASLRSGWRDQMEFVRHGQSYGNRSESATGHGKKSWWKLLGQGVSSSERLKVRCPSCGARLRGATAAMIGDLGVCAKCKHDFVIEGRPV